MTKKLLLMAVCTLTALFANAQACQNDPIYADSSAGIWPDSATGLPHAQFVTPTRQLSRLKR